MWTNQGSPLRITALAPIPVVLLPFPCSFCFQSPRPGRGCRLSPLLSEGAALRAQATWSTCVISYLSSTILPTCYSKFFKFYCVKSNTNSLLVVLWRQSPWNLQNSISTYSAAIVNSRPHDHCAVSHSCPQEGSYPQSLIQNQWRQETHFPPWKTEAETPVFLRSCFESLSWANLKFLHLQSVNGFLKIVITFLLRFLKTIFSRSLLKNLTRAILKTLWQMTQVEHR